MHVHQMAPNVAHGVWPWAALLLLGAVHGINPGMGWLFAVALGMQRQERGAVWRALLPLAGGHAAAIAVAAIIVFVAATPVRPSAIIVIHTRPRRTLPFLPPTSRSF